jgi:hypothetical protein
MKQNARYLFLLVVLSVALYGFLPAGWWYYDDPLLVTFASQHTVAEILFNPEVWLRFSPFNLVPWVILSLKIDAFFAGFAPHFYYLHQILALTIVVSAVFAVFTLYLKARLSSFAGAVIFLLHPATFAVVSWITTRHYLEGLGFGLFSIYFYVRALRDRRPLFIAISTLFFVFALMSKEVYVPLAFLLVLLPEERFLTRIRYALPAFVVTGLYIFYRAWMLGNNTLGGYSAIWPWTVKSALLSTPEMLKSYGNSWVIPVVISLVVIGSFFRLEGWKGRLGRASRGLLLFSLFYLPIVPVSPLWGGLGSLRYFFVLSLFITFCYAASVDLLAEKEGGIRRALAIISVFVVIGGFSYEFTRQKTLWQAEKAVAYAEGRFFLENSGRSDAIFRINQPHWFFDGLEEMESEQSGEKAERKIRLVAGEFYGLDGGEAAPDPEVFSYDRNTGEIVDIRESAGKSHEGFLKTLQNRPLSVDMTITDGIMKLRLGPYEGRYTFLEASPSQPGFYYLAFPVNRVFGIKLTHREKIRIFRFAFTSPEGWTTLSPEFLVDRTEDQTVQWNRR